MIKRTLSGGKITKYSTATHDAEDSWNGIMSGDASWN